MWEANGHGHGLIPLRSTPPLTPTVILGIDEALHSFAPLLSPYLNGIASRPFAVSPASFTSKNAQDNRSNTSLYPPRNVIFY
jgi:hypothetical protein